MSSFSSQLYEAVSSKDKAERVVLVPGQVVAVRTKRGVNVINKGQITFVDKPTGIIRVQDIESGVTLEVDVDPEKYIVWILPPPKMDVDRVNRISTLYTRGGFRPSVY